MVAEHEVAAAARIDIVDIDALSLVGADAEHATDGAELPEQFRARAIAPAAAIVTASTTTAVAIVGDLWQDLQDRDRGGIAFFHHGLGGRTYRIGGFDDLEGVQTIHCCGEFDVGAEAAVARLIIARFIRAGDHHSAGVAHDQHRVGRTVAFIVGHAVSEGGDGGARRQVHDEAAFTARELRGRPTAIYARVAAIPDGFR